MALQMRPWHGWTVDHTQQPIYFAVDELVGQDVAIELSKVQIEN